MNIQRLKGLNIESCIDIGAHIGGFYSMARAELSLDPSKCMLIEANINCEPNLRATGVRYKIAVLSDCKKSVTYFKANHDPVCTGNSYYRELTVHYRDDNINTEMMETDTLDNVAFRNFDLIKIDTQGSELDILRGGLNTLSKAKAVILETSIIPYNNNAPLQDEVISFMKTYGFTSYTVIGELLMTNQNIHQQDLLFLR